MKGEVTMSATQTDEGRTNGATEPGRVSSQPIDVRLFTIPGSHPGVSVQRMLEYKGIPYKLTNLLPVVSWGVLRAMRFPRVTVPAMRIDGRRIQGSREITRELERVRPEPPLFPTDSEHRAAVEEIERFGDADLQHRVRQIFLWVMRRNTASLSTFLEGSKIGLPHGLAVRTAGPFIMLDGRAHSADDANVRGAVAMLPEMLQRIDDWIGDGVLGGEELNAADFQIAPSLRLAMSLDDLRPAIEHRAAGRLALRVVPDYPGRIPPALPTAWLEPLYSDTSIHQHSAPQSDRPDGARNSS
jgi:glutathione S-transferase